jgi:hypothetical protein
VTDVTDLELDTPEPPWVIFTSEAEAARSGLLSAFRGEVKRIDGRVMSGPASSFGEIASAVQFPSYFGYNWDALDECLGDVRSWLHEDAVLVLVEHADSLVATEHFPMLVDVLCSGCERAAARYDEDGIALDRNPTALHFAFLVDGSLLKEAAVRLRKSGRRTLPITNGLSSDLVSFFE